MNKLVVQLADKPERQREPVFGNSLDAVMQRFNIVLDVVNIGRDFGAQPDVGLDGVLHGRLRSLDLRG